MVLALTKVPGCSRKRPAASRKCPVGSRKCLAPSRKWSAPARKLTKVFPHESTGATGGPSRKCFVPFTKVHESTPTKVHESSRKFFWPHESTVALHESVCPPHESSRKLTKVSGHREGSRRLTTANLATQALLPASAELSCEATKKIKSLGLSRSGPGRAGPRIMTSSAP